MDKNHDFRKYAVHHLGMSGSNVDRYASQIQNMTPYIIEDRPGSNFRAIDVFTKLISERIIFLGMGIDDWVANLITAQLLYLQSDSNSDVTMYINSGGGSVYAGFGIYDTMEYINPDVSTVCTGLAASMAAVLLASGAEGKRFSLPHSRIMIHQPMSGMHGQVTDLEISLKETLKVKKELYDILVKHTGHSIEKIEKDADRDYWMNGAEAKEYKLIDDVLSKAKPIEKGNL